MPFRWLIPQKAQKNDLFPIFQALTKVGEVQSLDQRVWSTPWSDLRSTHVIFLCKVKGVELTQQGHNHRSVYLDTFRHAFNRISYFQAQFSSLKLTVKMERLSVTFFSLSRLLQQYLIFLKNEQWDGIVIGKPPLRDDFVFSEWNQKHLYSNIAKCLSWCW